MHYDATRRYGFTEIGHSAKNLVHKSGTGGRRAVDNLSEIGNDGQRFQKCHVGDRSGVLDHDRDVTARDGPISQGPCEY